MKIYVTLRCFHRVPHFENVASKYAFIAANCCNAYSLICNHVMLTCNIVNNGIVQSSFV